MPTGNITKRQGAKGPRWRVRIELDPDPITGKRRQTSKTFGRRKEAEAWQTKTLNALRESVYVEPSSQPLSDLLNHWLETIDVRPNSWRTYESYIRCHLLPELGSVPLKELTPARIQRFYNGKRDLPSVGRLHVILRSALRQAVREQLLPRNPTDGLPAPKPARRVDVGEERVKVWSATELTRFLDETRDHDLWPLWRLAAYTGLRVGELVALRWQDVDLERALLRVVMTGTRTRDNQPAIGPAKTDASARRLGLDTETVSELRRHRQGQLERRLALGEHWQEHDLVFPYPDGRPQVPELVSQRFTTQVRRLRLPALTIHGLRHTHASLLLANRYPVHYVSARLGHRSIQITLDLYGWMIPGDEHGAAEEFAGLLQRARDQAVTKSA